MQPRQWPWKAESMGCLKRKKHLQCLQCGEWEQCSKARLETEGGARKQEVLVGGLGFTGVQMPCWESLECLRPHELEERAKVGDLMEK